MKNYRTSDFDQVPKKSVNKSFFDLSHEFKTQMCFGRYYPIHWEEAYPGDEFKLGLEFSGRYPSLYFPIQQIATWRADWFFAPYNILFRGDFEDNYNKTGWKGFIMGEDIELPTTKLNINGHKPAPFDSLYPGCSAPIENYMGFPFDKTGRVDADKQWSVQGNAFPIAMYLMCYDEYYRNPLWEEPVFFNLEEGDNSSAFDDVVQKVDGITYADWDSQSVGGLVNVVINHPPFFAHYEKDYFTAARPEPQDGDPLQIPNPEYPVSAGHVKNLDGTIHPNTSIISAATTAELQEAGGSPIYIEQETATIPQLRKALILQQFHEMVARFGKRYRDWIRGTHDVNPEPGLIDIPHLIGSHFGRITVSDAITSADTEDAQTGNYRGNMNHHDTGEIHNYFCQDYGIIMCIVNVMPNTGYGQGIHPKWTREVYTDYPLDVFSGIGDQEIKRKELLALNIKGIWDDNNEPYNTVIGYNDRFAEAKTAWNRYFSTQDMYDSFYMGQRLDVVEADYDEVNTGRLILGTSYKLSNGIREIDVFNKLPIKQGNSTYVDSTIYAHFYLTIKVNRCLPFFSTPGKQIW